MFKIPLYKEQFQAQKTLLAQSEHFEVFAFKYNLGVEAIEIKNSQGHLVILPFMGQMIWDAEFLDTDLCMKNMFREPKPAKSIVETYGCFAFHAGMIRMGCPTPQDDHVLHGEMPCAAMDFAWLEVSEEQITLAGSYEYVMGFGDHYLATPSVTLGKDASLFDIRMAVKNLASVEMPLQYMCHINAAFIEGAVMTQNIPGSAFNLRESVPAHVKPTQQWLAFNEALKGAPPVSTLDQPEMYNPEIVYCLDNVAQYVDKAQFKMQVGNKTLVTEFSTQEFNSVIRWILRSGDQQVAAYALPATCRPEGFLTAKQKGTLIYLAPQEERSFTVRTGIVH
ncbi:aldose 1-epimerase family protein [Vibrio rhodolitus]|uniref:aldose 1-epimerase family protein n=1 Tax=Vibrio rhodolitus TaxID=2231649 RepID=UPI000E0C4EA1|nr:aldose 1-epimerase family protein [Vibrio rhodolitus]